MIRSTPKRNRSSRVAGHTLMELMVVMVLMAAAASLVAPVTVRAYSHLKLRLAGASVAKLFQQAKSRALFEGQTYFVIFSPATGRGRQLILVRVDGKSVNEVSLPADTSVTGRRGGRDWTSEIEPLAFYPDGTTAALELNLKNASRFPLRLSLDPTTARVRFVRESLDEE